MKNLILTFTLIFTIQPLFSQDVWEDQNKYVNFARKMLVDSLDNYISFGYKKDLMVIKEFFNNKYPDNQVIIMVNSPMIKDYISNNPHINYNFHEIEQKKIQKQIIQKYLNQDTVKRWQFGGGCLIMDSNELKKYIDNNYYGVEEEFILSRFNPAYNHGIKWEEGDILYIHIYLSYHHSNIEYKNKNGFGRVCLDETVANFMPIKPLKENSIFNLTTNMYFISYIVNHKKHQ